MARVCNLTGKDDLPLPVFYADQNQLAMLQAGEAHIEECHHS